MATGVPAVSSIHRIPRQLHKRYGVILRDALAKHAEAETWYGVRPSADAEIAVKRTSCELWLISGALLMRPFDDASAANVLKKQAKVSLTQGLKKRFQLAEGGKLHELVLDYLEDLHRSTNRHRDLWNSGAASAPAAACDRVSWLFRRLCMAVLRWLVQY